MRVKRFRLAGAALAMSLSFTTPAMPQGVPVIDTTAIAQFVQQLQQMAEAYETQLEELKAALDQLAALQAQLETAQEQLQSITGSREIAQILNTIEDIKRRASAFSLESLQEAALSGNPLAELTILNSTIAELRAKFDIAGLETIWASDLPVDKAIAEQASAAIAAMATAEDTYQRANDAMGRINSLIGSIDANQDLKASIDFNTRVMAELAVLLNENLRIQAANTNVGGASVLSEARESAVGRQTFILNDE